MSFKITVQGIEPAVRYFRSRSGKIIPIVTPAFRKAGEWVRREMLRGYDTPGNPDVYVRTGTYGRKMQIRQWARSGEIVVNVYNLTPYAHYVGVKPSQAWMHRGKWPTDEDTLKDLAPDIIDEVSGALIRGLVA